MNRRQKSILYGFFLPGVSICLFLFASQTQPALAQDPHPTPTYDPLAQPELPPNPTDLEMGRYLFWRHCMPCHGDVGQGLTDEFRALWEEHQNCWESGCHGGKSGDEGFPIPTVIPAIVRDDHLRRFTSEQELFEYLKATHPPQYPGHLENEEYHAISSLLFKLNERSEEEAASAPVPSPAPTLAFPSAPVPLSQTSNRLAAPVIFAGLGLLILAAILIRIEKFRKRDR